MLMLTVDYERQDSI